MSEETINKQEMPEQLSDILLVLDKERMKIQAVKGIDDNGNIETVSPAKRNQNQFMRVDKSGDIFSNFFSNFFSQLKNPTNFSFFKVPIANAAEKAKELQNQVNKPTPEGEKVMKELEVKVEPNTENIQENNNDMATTQTTPEASEYRFKPEQIDWDTMKNLGLSKEYLEKRNLLDPLLRGYKTKELVPVSVNFGTTVLRTDARLSLQRGEEGNAIVALHGIKKEPVLHLEFFGHKFTDEDKKNLLETGNMGRVVNLLNPRTGELMPSIVSIDRLTNDVIALRTDYIKIPDEIKGVKLDDSQKQTLMEGKPLQLDGMISNKGREFSAVVQYNAEKRYPEFFMQRGDYNQQARNNQQDSKQNQQPNLLKDFRGKELSDDQRNKLKDGQSVYIELTDKKNQPYTGYITLNKQTDKLFFEFPDKYKQRVQASDAHKTQTAVNSEGKTNETTKNIKEPLQKGQQRPKNEKQQEQQDKPKAPAKPRSRKAS